MTAPNIAIVGGGIGGLTAAVALRRKGFSPIVYEKVPVLKPVGAGIVLSTNAMNALAKLDLADDIAKQGWPAKAYALLTPQGELLHRTDMASLGQRFGRAPIGITRSALHQILLNALPKESVQLGVEFTTLQDFNAKVQSEILIGADGLRSRVRKDVLGAYDLTYNGVTGWRGLGPVPKRSVLDSAFETLGPGRLFGAVQVSESQVYWFVGIKAPASSLERDPDKVKEAIKAWFKGWHDPIEELVDLTPSSHIINDDIYYAPPTTPWYRDHVVCLGDAIHPTTPDLGQGAGMAIESALALAHSLASHTDVQEAFAHYQRTRQPRTAWVTQKSLQWSALSGIKHPVLRAARNTLFKIGSRCIPRWIEDQQLTRLVGYEATF